MQLPQSNPVINTYPPSSCPSVLLTGVTLFLTLLLSYCRYWDKEVLRARKDSREPSLTKAIIKCYWKSYVILGIFTLIEVNVSRVLAAVSEWVYQQEVR